MNEGTIVRRILQDRTMIGPYLVVVGKASRGYCKTMSTVQLPKENRKGLEYYYPFAVVMKNVDLAEIPVCRIQITGEVFARIKLGIQTSLWHPCSAQWMKIFKKEPEIVQIRNFHNSDEVLVFKVDNIKKIQCPNGPEIRLDLDYRIL